MKQTFTILAAFLALSVSAQTQKQVYLRVVHQIDTSACATNVVGETDQGDEFKLTRVQYYLHDFAIVHDGGTQTTSESVALVNGFNTTLIDLGTMNVDSLEAIKFGVGVNDSLNHLDPTTYSAGHPLALQNPSMHWGWTSGYRFIAIEGLSGTSFSKTFQYHCLGDNNYWHQTIATNGQHSNDTLVITINGNYEAVFNGLNLSTGPIVHSATGDAVNVMANLNNHVFTSEEGNAALEIERVPTDAPMIYPNPSNGTINLVITQETTAKLYNSNGVLVLEQNLAAGTHQVSVNQPGLYVISLTVNNEVHTQKILVQ